MSSADHDSGASAGDEPAAASGAGGASPEARPLRLGELTTGAVAKLLSAGRPVVVLLPVGSVEPHGPHLPLVTDTIISDTAAARAAGLLAAAGIQSVLAPPVHYGVTDFAAGFAGAVSLPPAILTSFLHALIEAYLRAGFAHVCLINNHLEPAQDAAVRAALEGLPKGSASVACPLTRRWGRTLSPEFKSGACHAGRYETSLVLAAASELVDTASASELPEINVSLSDGIKAGKHTFREMGMDKAYAGAPAAASAEEGNSLYAALAAMVAGEVEEGLKRRAEG